jgi:hypothetical protein
MTIGPKPLARHLSAAAVGLLLATPARGLDQNGDGLNDIWALSYGVSGLAAAGGFAMAAALREHARGQLRCEGHRAVASRAPERPESGR